MNKKGFSLVELLMIIVIVGILFGVGTLSYTALISSTTNKIYTNYENSMISAGEMYIIDNPTYISTLSSINIPINTLISNNLLDNIKNPDDINDTCTESYVTIIKNSPITSEDFDSNNINIEYHACLICNKYQTDGCIPLGD